jgi:hypothetical protein
MVGEGSFMGTARLHELQPYKVQLPFDCGFTDQIEHLLAKIETLQAEIDSLRKVNIALQSPCENVPRITMDHEGNLILDKGDEEVDSHLPTSLALPRK